MVKYTKLTEFVMEYQDSEFSYLHLRLFDSSHKLDRLNKITKNKKFVQLLVQNLDCSVFDDSMFDLFVLFDLWEFPKNSTSLSKYK